MKMSLKHYIRTLKFEPRMKLNHNIYVKLFYFPLYSGMIMCKYEFKAKEIKVLTMDETEPKHTIMYNFNQLSSLINCHSQIKFLY